MYRLILIAALLLGTCLALPARAAQSYDNCAGFIDSVPATISTPGVWCLRRDVSTANTSGNAITVSANNVTIDCNDFKIGGLAAGDGSLANGINSPLRQNVTVRHCGVRGFRIGIISQQGAGLLLEDNRLDNNLSYGIYVTGDNARIRRNAVYDTGGATGGIAATGIYATGDVVDNDIKGVFASGSPSYPTGISALGYVVSGNRISDLVVNGAGIAWGINGDYSKTSVVGNQINAGAVAATGWGIRSVRLCANNTVIGFSTAYDCGSSTGNLP